MPDSALPCLPQSTGLYFRFVCIVLTETYWWGCACACHTWPREIDYYCECESM